MIINVFIFLSIFLSTTLLPYFFVSNFLFSIGVVLAYSFVVRNESFWSFLLCFLQFAIHDAYSDIKIGSTGLIFLIAFDLKKLIIRNDIGGKGDVAQSVGLIFFSVFFNVLLSVYNMLMFKHFAIIESIEKIIIMIFISVLYKKIFK